MQLTSQGFWAKLKFAVFIVVHLLIALLATGFAEAQIGRFLRPHSLPEVLYKAWTLSAVCAATLGFSIHRLWKNGAAKWTWVLPSLWLGLRFVPAFLSAKGHLFGPGISVWYQFSGLGCENGTRSLDCRNFFVFTIPFIRGLTYSFGVWLSARLDSRHQKSTATASAAT